ncbi:periplasmic heavy metal sensor [candidate division WOR-3 bacterium]|nr:periplasmic heavy metal sensor [candidate division WOR-3 bacterium]
MRQKWLVVVVVASLALNLAVVASFLFLRLREPGHGRHRPVPGLGPEEVRGLRRLRKEFHPRMDSLRGRALDARTALMRYAGDVNPDPRVIDSLLGEIGRAEAGMNRLAFEHARRIVEQLPPEARDTFLRRLEEHRGRCMIPGRMMRRMHQMNPPPDGEIPPEDTNP